MPNILVIDDNEAVFEALELLFSLEGMESRWAETPVQGLALLSEGGFDLVVQDMNFTADTTSGGEGVALFRQIRDLHPSMPIILLTAWANLETAIALVREGASDYLSKPWDDEKLLASVRNLVSLGRLSKHQRHTERSRQQRHSRLADTIDLAGLVYASEAVHEVVTVAAKVAPADIPVLVTGPNGSGKELLADLIHRNSAVCNGPLVKVNAGALPADLMEAELFGAEAGAFTGASKTRVGRFEAANGGTLFLDEIGNLPMEGQIKLLRVLQTGQFERLGSNTTQTVKVRLISATNADLPAMIAAGTFREDLYYRLNVIELSMPPLAERMEDVLPIASALMPEGSRLSEQAQQALLAHDWPGNVRELRNVLQRAVLLAATPTIEPKDLKLPNASLAVANKPIDREAILAALDAHNGVIKAAALALGISRQALYRRMEKFDISTDDGRDAETAS